MRGLLCSALILCDALLCYCAEKASPGVSAAAQALAEAAARGDGGEDEEGFVDLGPEILRDYLKFQQGGDGKVDQQQFCAIIEMSLLKRNLKV